jgi:hypothetical protein
MAVLGGRLGDTVAKNRRPHTNLLRTATPPPPIWPKMALLKVKLGGGGSGDALRHLFILESS